jgi:hypothetical protein
VVWCGVARGFRDLGSVVQCGVLGRISFALGNSKQTVKFEPLFTYGLLQVSGEREWESLIRQGSVERPVGVCFCFGS